MSYTKTTWVDRVVQYPGRYSFVEAGSDITLTRNPGTVTAAGTDLNATNMQNMEDGIEANDLNITKLDNVTKYLTATAGSNGDFNLNITNTLATNMVLHINIPTATDNTQNARLSIDNGSTYKNIKYLRGSSTIIAEYVENQKLTVYYNGTDWIIKSNIVAIYELSAAGTTTGAITVDLNSDGGVYDISVIGDGLSPAGTNPGAINVFYNGDTTATNYYYTRTYNNGSSLAASTGNNANAGYLYDQASVNFMTLANSTSYPMIRTANVVVNATGSIEALDYMQYCQNTKTNITSLTFTTANNMGAGTKFIICKRC